MTGRLTPAMTHGQNESILFARANSNAAALWGFAKRKEAGKAGFPSWSVWPASPFFDTCNRDGDKRGDEKDRRYRAIKKISLRAQKRKRTVRIKLLASLYVLLQGYIYLICIV